jgi:glyoxylase-like metal-dependent hydrolase (beta-lactamase superfamily II)
MFRSILALTLLSAGAAAQDAKSLLDAALQHLGTVRSIQYTGSGAVFTVGQNVNPSAPWPRVEVKSFTRTIDYEKAASRTETVGVQGPAPAQLWNGDLAWNSVANPAPAAPAVVAERQMQVWVTPHGFLRGAQAHNAARKKAKVGGRQVSAVSFTAPDGRRFTGLLNDAHEVEKVETWLANPVLGDMHVETIYSDYRDFGGVRFPTKMTQRQGGFPAFDFTITAVQANPTVDVTVPDQVRRGTPPAVKVASEKLADGVWYITGGSHHSLLVEFANHLAVIEAPQTEDRSNAVIAEVKKLVPAKPIRYLVNTHHHFDHSGGLRTYVAEGATVVTHQVHQAFYKTTLGARRTLQPDRQTRERKKPRLLAVGARHVLSDGTRTVEIHHVQGNPHHDGILMAYLPQEKILVEVDVYSPLAANASVPATPPPAAVNLWENIQRLGLDVERIAPLHGRVVPLAELRRTIGK